MPADRELALPGAGARMRDFARRHGFGTFWSWWMREIASLVPAGPRAAVQRRRTRPVIAFDGDVATFWQPAIDSGRFSMVETATVALGGEPATTVAEGRAAVARQTAAAGGVLPKVVISLDGRAVLRKTLVLPAAVEEDLRQALTYDLDRHTPFKSEEL